MLVTASNASGFSVAPVAAAAAAFTFSWIYKIKLQITKSCNSNSENEFSNDDFHKTKFFYESRIKKL